MTQRHLASQEHLLVAHSDCIAALSFAPRGEEVAKRVANYRVKHLHESEVSILSVTAAVQREPDLRRLFGWIHRRMVYACRRGRLGAAGPPV